MFRTKVIALLLPVALAISAETPGKKVWEWTVEERLAARFDREARQARVDEYARNAGAKRSPRLVTTSSIGEAPLPFDSLRGSATPELLLPYEIFGEFIRVAYAFDDREAVQFRLDAASGAARAGLPSSFMAALAEAVRETAETERGVRELRERLNRGAGSDTKRLLADLRRLETEACRARMSAMTALRGQYPEFDRFLYETIAPNLSFAVFEVQDPEVLRRNERGCR